MSKVDSTELMGEFRSCRNQSMVEQSKPKKFGLIKKPLKCSPLVHKNVSSDKYQLFLNKYHDLENTIDTFKPQDLMYYFREKSAESGYKYVISNMKRDLGIFKKLLNNYSPSEVCLMIEFLFNSEQNYLDPAIIQPTVLVSGWCNTIYRDSMLWVDDKYIPKFNTSPIKKQNKSREWGNKGSETKTNIGEWD